MSSSAPLLYIFDLFREVVRWSECGAVIGIGKGRRIFSSPSHFAGDYKHFCGSC